MLMDTISFVSGADWNYDIAGSTLSTPGDGDIITRFVATRAFKLPASMAGASFDVGVNPSSAATLTLKKNGTGITNGTVSISTGGVATPGAMAETSFAIGDVLEIEVTTANALDDLSVTLKTLAP